MKLNEIYLLANEIAPKVLSECFIEKYGAYDNSGIIIDTGEDITGILFSLDLSNAAIEQAQKINANLIITHHPAIYAKISSVRVSDINPLGEKLTKCLKNGISVISMHLNLDAAVDGIDENLMLAIKKAAGKDMCGNALIMQKLEKAGKTGGYGRVYDVSPIPFEELSKNLKIELDAKNWASYKNGVNVVKRVASFCGGGSDEEAVEFAINNGADVIVSADFRHHILLFAKECKIAVIAPTHYASENYGFKKYYEKIKKSISIPCGFYTDTEML